MHRAKFIHAQTPLQALKIKLSVLPNTEYVLYFNYMRQLNTNKPTSFLIRKSSVIIFFPAVIA